MTSLLKKVLQFNSIKGNIIFSMIIMGFITFVAAGSSFWFSYQQQQSQQLLHLTLTPAQSALESIKAGLHKAPLALHAYLETGKEQHRKAWQDTWEQEILSKLASHQLTYSLTVDKLTTDQLSLLRKIIPEQREKQLQFIEEIRQYYASSTPTQAGEEIADDFKMPLRHSLASHQAEIEEAEQSVLLLGASLRNRQQTEQLLQQNYLNLFNYTGVALLLLCLISGFVVAYGLISQVIRSMYHIKQAVKALAQGNLPEQVRQSKNETSYITQELQHLTNNLRNVQQFALKVGDGQFDNVIDVFNNSGDLGSSLASMRDSLAQVAREDKQRNWVNEGFARFGDILRNHNHSIAELSDVTISNLVKYVGANQGAIFLVQEGNGQHEEVLQMASCYAYERKKYQQKEILKGEGLCGQAWQEKDIILINDVPQDYVNIRSGLGGATPKAVLVVPLIANEQTQGILELASFASFQEYQVTFIRKIAENMASAIATARNNEKTQKLLEEFQNMTEQLRAQEEEMRQNMEELKSTQEEMERAQREVVRKEYNLNSVINNTADTIFALDQDYRITVVNKVLSDKYRKMGIDLQVGTLISDVLPKSAWEVWKIRYDRGLAGEHFTIVEESSGTNGTRFSQTYHNPIRDDEGRVIGVSVISRDVTESVVAQKEAEYKRSTLS
ncbi:MAG: GAF domain-containing protein, partial [Bacteroidetes bacterium]|nr:GAF domain-containing protein [Bacteroidota bacterium]